MLILSKYKAFQRLSAKQWLWLAEAYGRLWPILLRIKVKQGTWLREQIQLTDYTEEEHSMQMSVHELAAPMHEAVRLAARLHFLPAHCLPKSIALMQMLKARKLDAQVKIGISKKVDSLSSHAWVECEGFKVAEPESVAQEFTELGAPAFKAR